MARHKLADIIIAWAEGKKIQIRSCKKPDSWRDVTTTFCPCFDSEEHEWRIKPKKKTGWLNIYPNGSAMIFPSEKRAAEGGKYQRIACIQIEYEEGQGS